MHRAIDRADLIVAIGHDAVEKPPFIIGDAKGPTVLHVSYLPATVEEVYFHKLNSSAISVRALSC